MNYVTKPVAAIAVLLARIRAQLRQHEQSEDATFLVGPYTFKAEPEAADTTRRAARSA